MCMNLFHFSIQKPAIVDVYSGSIPLIQVCERLKINSNSCKKPNKISSFILIKLSAFFRFRKNFFHLGCQCISFGSLFSYSGECRLELELLMTITKQLNKTPKQTEKQTFCLDKGPCWC